MSKLGIEKLVFDPTEAGESANVGAYVRSADGTLITHTTVSGKDGLDVNIINSSLEVTATDLDIRDLDSATDSVTAIQGTSPWVVSGTVTIDDDANKAEDSAHTSGDIGKFVLAVRQDANTPMAADGDYHPLVIDENGRLKVAAEVTVEAGDAEYLEDTPHNSGDAGIHTLSVRQDVLSASTSADGDYASFKTDSVGALWARLSQLPQANGYTAGNTDTFNVTTSAAALPTTPLASRKELTIQNTSNRAIFYGYTNAVTTSTGIRVAAGAFATIKADASLVVYVISDAAATIRYEELA